MIARNSGAQLAGLLLVLAISGAASGQERPSLERIEEAVCTLADENGSYRPIFCDPRCDCLAGRDLSLAATCEEASPGLVLVSSPPTAPHDAVCFGTCSEFPVTACLNDGDCSTGVCINAPSCYDLVAGPCVRSEQCDQSKGFSCETGFCFRNYGCEDIGGVCETGLVTAVLSATFGVAPSENAAPLECAQIAGSISSTDAAACVTEVETHLGAGACVICGDGNLDAGEQCDDGNLTPGDGCAADCTTE